MPTLKRWSPEAAAEATPAGSIRRPWRRVSQAEEGRSLLQQTRAFCANLKARGWSEGQGAGHMVGKQDL